VSSGTTVVPPGVVVPGKVFVAEVVGGVVPGIVLVGEVVPGFVVGDAVSGEPHAAATATWESAAPPMTSPASFRNCRRVSFLEFTLFIL
jgi:hypothetical protein